MKNSIKLAMVAVAAMAFSFSSQAASKCWFWQVECKLEEALQKLESGEESTTLVKLCRKGAAASGVFSLRSFNGKGCEHKLWAAFAEVMCVLPAAHAEDYSLSHCHQNAVKALENEDPRIVLMNEVKNLTGTATNGIKKAICSLAGDKLASVCGAAN